MPAVSTKSVEIAVPTTAGIADFRSLHGGRDLFVVDDSAKQCAAITAFLADHFLPGRVTSEADPVRAEATIRERLASGSIDLLVLDLCMPERSGRQILFNLAADGLFVRTVIHSGMHGNDELRKLVDDLSAVGAGSLVSNGGLGYVSKERAASDQGALITAIGEVLDASESHAETTRDLLARASALVDPEALPIVFTSDELVKRHQVIVQLYDCYLSAIPIHRKFMGDLLQYMADHEITGDQREVEWLTERLWVADPDLYQHLHQIGPVEMGYILHEVIGSQGLNGCMMHADMLIDSFPRELRADANAIYGPYCDLLREAALQMLVLKRELQDLGAVQEVNLVDVIEKLSSSISVPIDMKRQAGRATLSGDKLTSLSGVFLQALRNSEQALESHSDPEIQVMMRNCRVSALTGVSPGAKKWFSEARGLRPSSEITMVFLSDNGPGFTDEVLAAWEAGGPIQSSKGDREGTGLNLLRSGAQDLGGYVTIGNNRRNGGAEVTIYLRGQL